MSVTVEEKFRSRRGRRSVENGNASSERVYFIRGTLERDEAHDALDAAVPATDDGLALRDTDVDEIGGGAWLGKAIYGNFQGAPPPPPEEGQSTFSFDTTGGTEHITQSLATIAGEGVGMAAIPDFGGGIGVTRDGVQGADIVAPVYRFSETHWFNPAAIDGAYKAKVFALTGQTNDASFRGFAAGEVLFLGASGSTRGGPNGTLFEITFTFAASPNVTGITLGPLNAIDKGGWHLLWVLYEHVEDAGMLAQQPKAVYVERVYEAGDFSELGIGT